MLRTYYVVFSLDQKQPVDHASAIQVREFDHGRAAARALAETRKGDLCRVAFAAGTDVFAWAWTDSAPKHPNGAPMCVHGLTLRRGLVRPEVAPIGGGA